MLLKILTLLKDEKIITTSQLYTIVENSRSEYEFDEAIKPYIKSSPADFKTKWANHGFAATKVSLWETLLKGYFNSSVETTVSAQLKISNADVINNVEAVRKIYREVAQDLAGSGFKYGDNIHKSIQNSVRTAIMNNRQKYRREFAVYQNNDSMSPTTTGESAEPLRRITDSMEALKNVPAAEVKALLADLYGTKFLYRFETDTSTHLYYSMYESFLRIYFEHEMADFNSVNKGQVEVTLSEHNENKYRKLDAIMRAVFHDFILPGISKDNISEFQHAIFLIVDKVKATSTVPVFGLKPLSNPDEEGNFGNNRTFASAIEAPKKFDNFIKGFIALSKLFHYLRSAGLSPYHIHADIFSFEFEDPSNKFLTLAEVVEFSSTYVQVRYKYNLKDTPLTFKAIQSKDNTGLLLPRNYEDVIIANRNKIVLDGLTSSVVTLTSSDVDMCYATMHIVDVGQKTNIFRVAESLSREQNPLYTIFKGDGFDWDDSDPEELVDMVVIREYFSKLLQQDASGYEYREMDRASFLEMTKKTKGDLRDLLDDLTEWDLDTQVNILRALEEFVFEFKGFMDTFNKKYPEEVKVSEVEYSTFLYKHPMFQDLHALVNPAEYRSRENDLVSKVILTLLRKYYPELTLQQLQDFLSREVKNISYGNFIDSIKSRTFTDITRYFHYAKANLFNLSEFGSPIRLQGQALTNTLNNLPHLTTKHTFSTKFGHIRSDRPGYLINDMGELYQIKTENNKVGALHGSGFYFFTDGTVQPWDS